MVGILGQTMTSWIHSEFNWPLVVKFKNLYYVCAETLGTKFSFKPNLKLYVNFVLSKMYNVCTMYIVRTVYIRSVGHGISPME